ncbi:MAG: DUF4268 domain-containing protein [Anaerolineales bacterium]|nr:DUF4268 domain-containing protein [Anaerolineales bacterium]
MTSTTLSHLQKIDDLRRVWQTEDRHFTPWLAQEENLVRLGDTIGLDLELEETEKNVGPFRADIVAKDTLTDTWVLIENQLERTNHTHLGQLLTYAAGLNAVTIVWIADRFADEHRATLDWLNEITDESINFFGLEIELWQIADSPIAPKFNIVSKPNEWTKTITAVRRQSTKPTSTQELQLEYWQAFVVRLENHKSTIKRRKPSPHFAMDFSIGRGGFRLTAVINTREKRLGVRLFISSGDIEAFYHLLLQDRATIEAKIGSPLEWVNLPNRKQGEVNLYNQSFDPAQRSQWPQQHAWLQQTLEAFHHTFSPRIKALNSDDYQPEEDQMGEVD